MFKTSVIWALQRFISFKLCCSGEAGRHQTLLRVRSPVAMVQPPTEHPKDLPRMLDFQRTLSQGSVLELGFTSLCPHLILKSTPEVNQVPWVNKTCLP